MNSNNRLKVLIFIPARYHSTRLPGKPLISIAGTPMLHRVWNIAFEATSCIRKETTAQVDTWVLTEDTRIQDYCLQAAIPVLMTSENCNSGTERAAEALSLLKSDADLIINLQGDNALCPPWFLTALVPAYLNNPGAQVITPYVRLDWQALDKLRDIKNLTPFSGTTVVFNAKKQALWFSKQILPAIRNEEKLREAQINNTQDNHRENQYSPVTRHIGIYAYRKDILQGYAALKSSTYEKFEGLEQLIFLEQDINVQMVEVDYRGRQGLSGIDSPEDIKRAERIIELDGELTSQ